MARQVIGRRPQSAKNTIGFGAQPGSMTPQQIGDAMSGAIKCPAYALETVAKVQWMFGGPLSPTNVTKTLGAQIKILGSGDSVAGVDYVYTTPGLINGEFQTHILAVHVGVHLEAEPMCWTIAGNAFPIAAFAASGSTKPFSPDTFTATDVANAWGGSTAPAAPAALQWGWWANQGLNYMVRAYNLRWTYGSLVNLLDEQLRDTAYMPPNAQEGSASSSQVDIMRMARYTNDWYQSTMLNTTLVFEAIDAIRQGSLNAGLAAAGQSTFSPTIDFRYADATYGGMDLRSMLMGNSEFRKLDNPTILKPGVPPGLIFEEVNTPLANEFRNQFDANSGLSQGAVPATTVEVANMAATATSSFKERTLDGAVATQTVLPGTVEFKGGNAFMSIEIKGPEITEWLACQIRDNPQLAGYLTSQTGMVATWGG